MMNFMSRFSPAERTRMIAGGAVILCIAGWFGLAEPFMNRLAAMDADIAALAERVARYRAVVQASASGQQPSGVADLAQLEAACFTAESDALAAAQMLELVRAKAQAAGITLGTSKPEKAEKQDGFRRINLEVTFAASLSSLSRFMQELENDTKRMQVREAKITSQKQDYPDTVVETLSARLLITGLRFLPAGTAEGAQ